MIFNQLQNEIILKERTFKVTLEFKIINKISTKKKRFITIYKKIKTYINVIHFPFCSITNEQRK